MKHRGFSHVGLATRDMEATRAFYENVLGFEPLRCDILKVTEGGVIHHVFYDTGGGQMLAFMGPEGIEGFPDFDAGINRGLGLPDGMIHFAFEAGSDLDLEAKRRELIDKGVKVSEVRTHDTLAARRASDHLPVLATLDIQLPVLNERRSGPSDRRLSGRR